ncbi:hypothetical protein JOC48_002867 [Aquibacillus albus]|uniref:Uncharacterized protein n=1 Tax=Aquibacillus albus TaxID=1168171 RepID=A0ABS2N2J1_9BACI|nr:hypothetical protein [Aquibacillus albus]
MRMYNKDFGAAVADPFSNGVMLNKQCMFGG